MKRWNFSFAAGLVSAMMVAQSTRLTVSFDADWQFAQHDVLHGQAEDLDTSGWRRISVPQDWAIYGPLKADAPSAGQGGFAPTGVSWYRKTFFVPGQNSRKRVFVEFDGVMANSDVWLNGEPLGHRPNGYVSFRYELTGKLHFDGRPNVIAVRTDTQQQPASRWYEGAGIYRHVRLVVQDEVHLAPWSIFVTTPEVQREKATVQVQAIAANQSGQNMSVTMRVRIVSPDGKIVAMALSKAQGVAANQSTPMRVQIDVPSPQRWDMDDPKLYRAHVELLHKGKAMDEEIDSFGIREFHFDAATGFWLNGRNRKIKGVALHNDGGAVGIAVPLAVWKHRLEALKKMGANAIRTAHGPVSPEFLDLCDRMGFVVMEEFFDQWIRAKNPYDYHLDFMQWALRDLDDTVRRDRNHPSIILYSSGNEIRDTPKPEVAKPILQALLDAYHQADPTRPVTQALFRPNVSHDYEDGLADMLDIVGQNYRVDELLAAHRQKPSRRIIGTENIHDLASWLMLRDHPEYSGMFIWAGVDYLGESRRWPLIADAEGLLDRTDAPKGDALQRESWWATHPVLHMVRRTAATPPAPTDPGYETEQYRPAQMQFADWTPRSMAMHDETVEVYSNCDEVELKLNGRSLGIKKRDADDRPLQWVVPFEAGDLEGVGYSDGKAVAREMLRTAGAPVRIALRAEGGHLGPSFEDVVYLRASVLDAHGVVVPDAHIRIHFAVNGDGVVVGTDNGDAVYESPLTEPDRSTLHGSAIAVVRGAGASGVTVHATAEGLQEGVMTLDRVAR